MARLLFTAWTFALLIGLFPLSNHMVSMPGMEMDAIAVSNQSNMAQERADEHSTSTCCDAITPCSLAIDILVSQTATIASYGGSKRAVSSAPTVQPIYIKTLSPPPKA